MEKTIRLTWSEVVKWLTLIVGITTTYVVMQVKISHLEEGRVENRHAIERLEERMRIQEAQVASINEKLTLIADDVKTIKDAVIDGSLNPGSHK